MPAIERPQLHMPFVIAACFGVAILLLGVFSGQPVAMQAGSFIVGAVLLAGQMYALTRGATFAFGLSSVRTVYFRERPLWFSIWLPLTTLVSVCILLAGFGTLPH